jgi:hypothetical protein
MLGGFGGLMEYVGRMSSILSVLVRAFGAFVGEV